MQASRPLPWYKGPKLAPFKFKDNVQRKITFLDNLGGGLHAEVFRAIIDGQTYAVKIFRFVHPTMLAPPEYVRDGLNTLEDVIFQYDPFYCECRAYGRLKETGQEDLAARCYGYVFLDPEQEAELAERGWEDWDRRPAIKGRPLRAIVKEYIPADGGPFTFEMLPKMRRDIQRLNKLGIINWDVREDNYRQGRLVDFSQAHTAPHMELDWNSEAVDRVFVKECCVRDQASFDGIVAQWNEDHPGRQFWRCFLPNSDYGHRLRKGRHFFHTSYYEMEGASYAAAFYDWEKKPEQRAQKRRLGANKRSGATKGKKTRNARARKAAMRKSDGVNGGSQADGGLIKPHAPST